MTITVMLKNVQHSGNVGAVMRAMATMGLKHLMLVAPLCRPDEQTVAMAAGSERYLDALEIQESLSQALASYHLVIGISARKRSLPLSIISPKDCASICRAQGSDVKIAWVFGPERAGLTNEDLLHCHYQVVIPTAPHYPSLNIAASVQVLAYEWLHKAYQPVVPTLTPLASQQAVHHMHEHLAQILERIGFIDTDNPRKSMPRLIRMFNRIQLEHMEVQMLRGILTAMERSLDK